MGTEGLRKEEPAEEAEDTHCVIHSFKCGCANEMHRENMIALSHQYGKQFKHIQKLDKANFRDPKTIGYSKGAAVNFNRFRFLLQFSFVIEL